MSVERALADLAQLNAEAQRARNRLMEIDEQAGRLRTYVAVAQEYERMEAGKPALTPPPKPSATDRTPPDGTLARRTTDLAVERLEEVGKPIHTRDLLTYIAQRGVTVGGRNPVANLSGFLSRDKARLVNSRTYGWSLRKWSVTDIPSSARFVDNSNAQHEPSFAGIGGATDGLAAGHSETSSTQADHNPRDPDLMHDALTEDETEAAWHTTRRDG